jgi:AmmeMemoRadiSam system protein B
MLTALKALGAARAQLIRYATSSEISGDPETAVGYAGMIFS